ncbi:MAG: asparagine synthase (glutamine-hydrolyzing) [Bdellovibrio sp.]|nr:MAG: asparagine synthase (glutamine-hydrolyzing) [Bdellovibrio sp.]
MCGIAGVLSTHHPIDPSWAPLLSQSLQHRGPDGEGSFNSPPLLLVHRRLSIIDLSEKGAQPMTSHSGRYTISFNGEVYNFLDLKKKLHSPLRGHSDTEVFLQLIEEQGLHAALSQAEGMWGFALWDQKTKTLTLCRDRMGEKPVYYGFLQKKFVFTSDLQALQKLDLPLEINPEALLLFLRYNCIPAPHSIYKSIYKLPPAHTLTLSPPYNQPHLQAYWTLPIHPPSPLPSFKEATIKSEQLLKRSIKHQQISDVPLGVFLSGGLDSTLIATLMQEDHSKPIHTFTIGFKDKDFDESSDARKVAQFLGTHHHEVLLTETDAQNTIPLLPNVYSEPFADSSQIPTLLLCQKAREQLKVCLSGDGGDEVFGGYNRYIIGPSIWNWIRKIPRPLRSLFPSSLQVLKWTNLHRLLPFRMMDNKIAKLQQLSPSSSFQDFYLRLLEHTHSPNQYFNSPNPNVPSLAFPFMGKDLVQQMIHSDLLFFLPDDILVKTDRASMSVGLEVRAPFLNHKLVEFLFPLPSSYKIHHSKGKRILRALLEKRIPSTLYERPKMGFAVPLQKWLRHSLRDWAEDLLSPSKLSPYLNPITIQKEWKKFLKGQNTSTFLIWNILMFQSWKERQ